MKKPVILLLISIFIQVVVIEAGTTDIFYATEDVTVEYVTADGSTNNYDFGWLFVQGDGAENLTSSVRTSLLKFDLSGIPDYAVIDSATFWILQFDDGSGTEAAGSYVGVHYVSDDSWTEAGFTDWSLLPAASNFIDEQKNTVDPIYYSWNLLAPGDSGDYWESWADDLENDDDLLSLMLIAKYESKDNYALFYSSEYLANYRPYLNIEYTIIPAPSAIILSGLGISLFGVLRKRKIL